MIDTVAVFGGSFNPPHVGHVLVVAYVLAACDIDRVLVVPCHQHPLDKQLAPFPDRVEMCRLAMAGLDRATVTDIASELGQAHTTFALLEALQMRSPRTRWRLVIGSDLLKSAPQWYRFDRVKALAEPLVIERDGYVSELERSPVLPNVSSTHVRECIAEGRSVAGLVTPAVVEYAAEHKLYLGRGVAAGRDDHRKTTNEALQTVDDLQKSGPPEQS